MLVALLLGGLMLLTSGCQLVFFEGMDTNYRLRRFPTSSNRGAPRNTLLEMRSRQDGGWGWISGDYRFYGDYRVSGMLLFPDQRRREDTIGSRACYLSGIRSPLGGYTDFVTICILLQLDGIVVETRENGTSLASTFLPGRDNLWVAIEGDATGNQRHFEYSTDGVNYTNSASVGYVPTMGYHFAVGTDFMTRANTA